MTATLQDIHRWIAKAKEKGASHLIIAVDTYDHENYPVYIGYNENIKKEIGRIRSAELQGIDEIYNMSMDIDKQLAEDRAYNI